MCNTKERVGEIEKKLNNSDNIPTYEEFIKLIRERHELLHGESDKTDDQIARAFYIQNL